MQELDIYVVANSSVGQVRDNANAQNVALPVLTRGGQYLMRLHLFAEPDDLTPLDPTVFKSVSSFAFAIDDDFDQSTTPLVFVDEGIVAEGEGLNDESESGSGSGSGSGGGTKETIITIPIPNTNGDRLVEVIGTAKFTNNLYAELVGRDAETNDIFVLQLEGFTIRNRILAPGQEFPVVIPAGAVIPVDGGGVAGMRLIRDEDGVYMPYFFDLETSQSGEGSQS